MVDLVNTHVTPPSPCPRCNHEFDRATGVTDKEKPEPGDLSVCSRCAAFLQFNDDMTIALFPDEKLFDISDGARLMLTRARKAILS